MTYYVVYIGEKEAAISAGLWRSVCVCEGFRGTPVEIRVEKTGSTGVNAAGEVDNSQIFFKMFEFLFRSVSAKNKF